MLALLAALTACAPPREVDRRFVATILPLAAILEQVALNRAVVTGLLPAGASPHTYDPRPADARAVESALALFYVDEHLDGWAAHLPAARSVAVFPFLPVERRIVIVGADPAHEHSHGDENPHFWMDPSAVLAILPGLTRALCEIDPAGEAAYNANAQRFTVALQNLETELAAMLAPVRGSALVTMHPSLDYLLHRYGIETAGVVEPSPGREISPRELKELIENAHARDARAVLTEPQLARRPAEMLAEAAGLRLQEVDPLGGLPGRDTYAGLIRYNARMLCEALQ